MRKNVYWIMWGILLRQTLEVEMKIKKKNKVSKRRDPSNHPSKKILDIKILIMQPSINIKDRNCICNFYYHITSHFTRAFNYFEFLSSPIITNDQKLITNEISVGKDFLYQPSKYLLIKLNVVFHLIYT
jgi:hypothetical protein